MRNERPYVLFCTLPGPPPLGADGNLAGPMEPPIEWERARALNRVHWDALAALHGQDAYYDTEALVAGRDTLTPEDDDASRASVGGWAGLTCFMSSATSALTRSRWPAGAPGSPASILSGRTGEGGRDRATLRRRDRVGAGRSTAIGPSLAGRFDLAYATIGVLCWIATSAPGCARYT